MSTTQTEVLNPTLHRAMVRAFGEVRVSHPGESFEARRTTDLATGRPRLEILQHGESYKSCCPFCGDRGFNLNVNHRYGTTDERVPWPLTFLATCFARGCLKSNSNRDKLFTHLDRGTGVLATARVLAGSDAPPVSQHYPQGFRHLSWFGDDHPAHARLRDCGLSPQKLGAEFGIGYCGNSDERLTSGRVIVPVTQDSSLVGWLAVRFAEDSLSFLCAPGMRAGDVVYNLDRAREFPAAVVVPSPEWVWRLGGPAVAPLTRAASERFANTVRCVFRRKQVVIVTPPDCAEDGPLTRLLSTALGPNFATVRLPGSARGADRKELRRLVRAGADERGLSVKFRNPGD